LIYLSFTPLLLRIEYPPYVLTVSAHIATTRVVRLERYKANSLLVDLQAYMLCFN
jgi:hypothetical protein